MDRSKWEYKKLGEVATFLNGYAFKPENWSKHGLKIIRIQNLTDETAPYNCYDGDIDPKYIVRNGDLLISWSATLGAFLWNNDDALLNQHIFKTIFDKSDIDKYYLKYCVISKLEEMAKKSHGVTMRHITKKDFDNTIIPYPSISDQQRIVVELDCLNEMIAVKKEQLKEFDKLAQSIFYDMFGDVSLSFQELNSLYEFIDYRGKTPNKISAGVPLITARNIRFGYLDYSVPEFISFEEFETRKTRGVAQKSDILFTTEAPMGFVAIADKDVFSTGQRVITLQRKNKVQIHNVYMLYYLMSEEFQRILLNNATGVTVKGIKAAKLKKIKVGVPPLSLQQQFAEKISAIEVQKELVKQSIAETQALLDYTMDKYFG